MIKNSSSFGFIHIIIFQVSFFHKLFKIKNFHIYITLTSINLFPSLIGSLSLRLINNENNLALSRSAPYS